MTLSEALAEIKRLQKLISKLSTPHFYRDERDPYQLPFESIEAVIACDDPGDVIPLRPFHELPTVWIRVKNGGYKSHDTHAAAEADSS